MGDDDEATSHILKHQSRSGHTTAGYDPYAQIGLVDPSNNDKSHHSLKSSTEKNDEEDKEKDQKEKEAKEAKEEEKEKEKSEKLAERLKAKQMEKLRLLEKQQQTQ